MPRIEAAVDTEPYDEFGMLQENAEEIGLSRDGGPPVARREDRGQPRSVRQHAGLGDDDPELVFLHGGGQNAHTWDTVVLALGRPALADRSPRPRPLRPPRPTATTARGATPTRSRW